MGNFHCVPSSCARVIYREYEPPFIRYRYSGEDWQEIIGDSYSIIDELGKCSKLYDVFGTYENGNAYHGNQGDIRNFRANLYGPIDGLTENTFLQVQHQDTRFTTVRDTVNNAQVWVAQNFITSTSISAQYALVGTAQITDAVRVDGQPDDCGDCIFKVFLNGVEVKNESRNECPEVEQFNCNLSEEYKEIKIDKLPLLDRIEVINENYDFTIDPNNNLNYDIDVNNAPSECLNIYKNPTIAPIDIQIETFEINLVSQYTFIAQICSYPGCPAPQFEVICGDCKTDCEQCPENTCPVECGEHICCYGTDGVAVKQIALDDYCQTNE